MTGARRIGWQRRSLARTWARGSTAPPARAAPSGAVGSVAPAGPGLGRTLLRPRWWRSRLDGSSRWPSRVCSAQWNGAGLMNLLVFFALSALMVGFFWGVPRASWMTGSQVQTLTAAPPVSAELAVRSLLIVGGPRCSWWTQDHRGLHDRAVGTVLAARAPTRSGRWTSVWRRRAARPRDGSSSGRAFIW
ncbi:hypothetical protein QJS66_05155 [Kocuria rhizophila]|nr:hypothetical protein QJS66_05155 [Kocuria rhizophila]